MILDYVFIAVFHWGLAGAAFATVTGELIGGTIPIFYFFLNKTSILHLGKTRFSGNVLAKTCLNGSSEMMTNISTSIVNMLYNFQVMRFAGEDGVAAYGVIMYANFIFAAMYLGYTIGCAPLISYNHGADNRKELHNLFKKSLMLISVTGILMLSIAQGLAGQVVGLFVGYDKELLALTITGFRIYSISYLLNGFNIWGSGFFTALGNGIISAQIAFFRTLLFQCSMVLLLPVFFGINGVWAAIIVAELLALVVTGQFLDPQTESLRIRLKLFGCKVSNSHRYASEILLNKRLFYQRTAASANSVVTRSPYGARSESSPAVSRISWSSSKLSC